MKKLLYKTADANLLKKASAVKFGWLAMDSNGTWYWFSQKPYWCRGIYWRDRDQCNTFFANVKFLKLPKRNSAFAKHSLIKCTSTGPILLSIGFKYDITWGMINIATANTIKKAKLIKGKLDKKLEG